MRFVLPALLLVGCIPDFAVDTSGVQTARPAPFAYPGIYSGSTGHGTLSYLIGADGRGRSCARHLGGRVSFGDVTYDGNRLHTEDGTFQVDAVTASELRMHTTHIKATLRKTDIAPTVCRDFFKERP